MATENKTQQNKDSQPDLDESQEQNNSGEAPKNPEPKKKDKKISTLDAFIAKTPELNKYSMALGFKAFCSKNFKAFKEFKTEEDCIKAFNKFYGREDK